LSTFARKRQSRKFCAGDAPGFRAVAGATLGLAARSLRLVDRDTLAHARAFCPVADTEIGRLGIMMAMEVNYSENGRRLAMNGAEVVCRASMPCPFTENDVFEISNRARALENNMYIVAPNIGSYNFTPTATILASTPAAASR
jgi:predicted amidohydrolase